MVRGLVWTGLLAATLVTGVVAQAAEIEDDGAAVVYVREECDVDGVEMKNCVDPAEVTPTWSGPMDFLSNGTDGWIWSTRMPDADSPLLASRHRSGNVRPIHLSVAVR